MTNVVDLSTHRADPHYNGEARCQACGHAWQAVAPAGTVDLQCPRCSLLRGVLAYPCSACEGTTVYRCNCGSIYFQFGAHDNGVDYYLLCIKCGLSHFAESFMP